MLLAIDIGNSNIKMAIFKGERIIHTWRIITDKGGSLHQYKILFRGLFFQQTITKDNIDQIIICSVVPSLTTIFKKALFGILKKRAIILGKNLAVPIRNLYRKPEQVGQDRLANALAAYQKYSRGRPIIIVDFGTALTFDVISATGSYLGGIIFPGIEVSLQALVSNADLLPEIDLGPARPKLGAKGLLGRDTVSSMKSGLIYGYACLVEGILRQLKKRYQQRPLVIATGGRACLMRDYCRSISKIDENLTLRGLKIAIQGRKMEKVGKKQ